MTDQDQGANAQDLPDMETIEGITLVPSPPLHVPNMYFLGNTKDNPSERVYFAVTSRMVMIGYANDEDETSFVMRFDPETFRSFMNAMIQHPDSSVVMTYDGYPVDVTNIHSGGTIIGINFSVMGDTYDDCIDNEIPIDRWDDIVDLYRKHF